MSTRTTALGLALAGIVLGVLFRAQFVERNGFEAADLAYYERSSYGVDLPDRYADQPYLLAWSRGDGQAYVTLAADPLAQGPVRGLGVALYRYARIGYALAALAVVAGDVDLIPYGLLAVNLAALGALGWMAGRRLSAWRWRAMALMFVPGALVSTASDTAEAFGIALAAVAVLSSLTMALIASAFLGIVRPDFATALFLRGRESIRTIALCAASAIAIRATGLALGLEWAGLNGNLTWPYLGYVQVLSEQPMADRAITIGILLVATLTVGHGLRSEQGWRRLAFLATGGFALTLAPLVVGGPQNSLRTVAALSLVWAVPAQDEAAETGRAVSEVTTDG